MIKNLVFAAALAAVVTTNAHATPTYNGVSINGVGINGISVNGVSVNGIGVNGIVWHNAVTLNGSGRDAGVLVGVELPTR